ncbi:hypothetical protein LTR17_022451 [Elasticomyces elasticus]|nr:hypothetical protein LTR17_022451 [Elasticomyces elasticus]
MAPTQPSKIKKYSVDAHLDDVLNALYTDGAVQIASLVPLDVVENIKAEVDRNKKTEKDVTKGDIFNTSTETVYGLAAKSPAAVEAVIRSYGQGGARGRTYSHDVCLVRRGTPYCYQQALALMLLQHSRRTGRVETGPTP